MLSKVNVRTCASCSSASAARLGSRAATPRRAEVAVEVEPVDLPGVVGHALDRRVPLMTVRQLRLVVHATDYDQALAFFRDVLGMPTAEAYSGPGGAEVTILDAGRATMEIANDAQIDYIDEVEVGRRVAPHFRVAFEVDDCRGRGRPRARAVPPVAPPTLTPWNSINARFDVPGEVHLTLFEERLASGCG